MTVADLSSKKAGEYTSLDTVMDTVLEAVGGDRKGKSSRSSRSEYAGKGTPKTQIIPGADTLEDVEAYLKKRKSEKLEEIKEKNRGRN